MVANKYNILVVEDDPGLNSLIRIALMQEGYRVVGLHSAAETFAYIRTHRNEELFVLIDYQMQVSRADVIIGQLKAEGIEFPYFIVTGKGNQQLAVEMMKQGALDYIVKEPGFDKLIVARMAIALKQYETGRALADAEETIRQHERVMLSKIVETEERERKRMSEELHDGLAPLLSSLKMLIEVIQADKFKSEQKRNDMYDQVYKLLNDSITMTRKLAHLLMPNIIVDFGLVTSVKSFVHMFDKAGRTRFEIVENVGNTRFDQQLEIVLYRSIVELINNTMKHSQASSVVIEMLLTDGQLQVTYKEMGNSVDFAKILQKPDELKGIGLYNALRRLQSFDCTVTCQGSAFVITKKVKQKNII